MATVDLVCSLDPTLPDVTLNIGGKVRKLAYHFGAICAVEKLTGLNLMRAASFDKLSFLEVRGLLYAALLQDDPELKLSDMDNWPIMYNLITIQAAIADAWFGSVTEPKGDVAGEVPARKARKKASRA